MRATIVCMLLLGCQGEQVQSSSIDSGADAAEGSTPSETGALDGMIDAAMITSKDCGTYRAGTSSMVRIDSFCIDVTEATHGQWKAFATAGDRSKFVPAHCNWNTMEPTLVGAEFDDYPRDNVNFCDAKTYCAWAGKRLCGKVGGGTVPYAEYTDATRSQWKRACSAAGKFKYPYGATYVPDACGTGMFNIASIKSYPACHGQAPPFSDVFDMSGNAVEWEDACQTPSPNATTLCRERGGASGDGAAASCDFDNSGQADARFNELGFRCCKDL